MTALTALVMGLIILPLIAAHCNAIAIAIAINPTLYFVGVLERPIPSRGLGDSLCGPPLFVSDGPLFAVIESFNVL